MTNLTINLALHDQTGTNNPAHRGTDIETSYKYLGVHMNNKLDWTDLTAGRYKKGQSRLHVLRKLRSFGVQGPLLTSFYDSVVASAIFLE